MPRVKETLRIEVEESTAEEIRTVTVTVTAPAGDFLLPDLLCIRGAVRPYAETLKRAVRETTEGYLAGAEGLIAGIATSHKQGDKAGPPVPKSKHNGNSKATAPGSPGRENSISEKSAVAADTEAIKPQAAV